MLRDSSPAGHSGNACRKLLEARLAAAEGIATLIVVAAIGNFEHFTWWAFTIYGTFLLATVVDYTSRVWVYAFVVQILVIAGVITMSTGTCSMLVNSVNQHGPALYLVGNFYLHYWPTVGILLRSDEPCQTSTQCALALLTFFLYASLWQPNSVYGCPVSYNAVVVAGGVGGVAVSGIFMSHDRSACNGDIL